MLLTSLERLTLLHHYHDELELAFPLIRRLEKFEELKAALVIGSSRTTLSTVLSQMLSNGFVDFDHSITRRRCDNLALER